MRKKKTPNDTNAQKYWRDFEKFILEYLKDYFRITDERMAKLTPPSGDGGYDGVIYWVQNPSNENLQEILFEAKLRSALGNAIPMNDISKALVIAINRFSDELYIATNIKFSPETMYQLDVYAKRTGIVIKTLNGKELFTWYQNFSRQSNTQKSPFCKCRYTIQEKECRAHNPKCRILCN